MNSLIAYLVNRHGLVRENVATELFVRTLEMSSVTIVRKFFEPYGVSGEPEPYGYTFETQRALTGEGSIPDVKVLDSAKNLCAIIESKFSASLTAHQPVDYLKALPRGGVLLFIAPESRRQALFDELLNKCNDAGAFEHRFVTENHRRARLGDKSMEVTSWKEALNNLAAIHKAHADSPAESSDMLADIDQLRRFCEVEAKELFEPLTSEQIRGDGISAVIHQLTWLTRQIIARCIERRIVKERSNSPRKNSSNALRAEADTSLCFGQEVLLSGAEVWIGFFGEAWETNKQTPLWIEIIANDPKSEVIIKRAQDAKGPDAVIRSANGRWLIPIPIAPERDEEQVVEDAVRFVSDLKDPDDE